MSLLKSEAALLDRLDELETALLVGTVAPPPEELLKLINDVRDELLDCWNIVGNYNHRF